MGSPTPDELKLLGKYIIQHKCKFILEVGGGVSTQYLGKAAEITKAKMISIDTVYDGCKPQFSNIEYMYGWSITQDDIITKHSSQFYPSPYKHLPDEPFALGYKVIPPPCDFIRKAFNKYLFDFYFGDSGEYCGLAE